MVSFNVATHRGREVVSLWISQTLMTPIVSPVYRIAEVGPVARPSRHSTGRVCEDIEPALFSGSVLSGFEISLDRTLSTFTDGRDMGIKLNVPEAHNLVRATRDEKIQRREDVKRLHEVDMGLGR